MRGIRLWSPFHEIERVRREFDRLIDNFFGDESERNIVFTPSIDMYETDKDIVIKAELPGVEKDNIELVVKDNFVHIRAERKEEKENKTEKYHRIERFYGSMERVIPLPVDVKAEETKAEYKNGILEIRIPKEKTSKETKIKIS